MKSNLTNRTIYNKDNLDVLKGINSNTVDLIYLDPPFNKKKVFAAPIGSSSEGASFKDLFREEDVKDEWVQEIKEDYDGLYKFLNGIKELSNITSGRDNKHYLYNYCYLCYIAIRLLEIKRILKDTGSVYLHCDNTMGHYLKILMDIIFGEKNFLNSITWNYRKWTNSINNFQKNHDVILFYKKNEKHIFNKIYDENTPQQKKMEKGYDVNVVQNGIKQLIVYDKEKSKEKINSGKYQRIVYRNDKKGVSVQDWWEIPIINSQSKERTGFPTQKPLALLERIIKASSNEGDLVLDPFCGCATTCVASEKLNRQWIGIDVSYKAYELVKKRLEKEVADPENLFQYENEINFSTSPPKRTDGNGDDTTVKKYVYIISHPKHKGFYKVGIASNYKARLNSYQTADPDRAYKLEYYHLTPCFREIEKHVHNKFNNLLEWVQASKEEIIKEIEDYE